MKRFFTLGLVCLIGISTIIANPRNPHQQVNTPSKNHGGSSHSSPSPKNHPDKYKNYHSQQNHHYQQHRPNTVIVTRPVYRPVIRPAIHINTPRPVYVNHVAPSNSFNFRDFIYTLKNQRFESDRLSVARQALYSNYMDTYQIKEVLSIMEYEDSRLEFAKDAYQKCVDKQNYYRVNDMFQYSSSVHALEEFIFARR